MQLVGRKNEIKNLEWDLQKSESQFVAIYGRRRIGKTYLIREMFSDTFAFSHTGLRGGDKKAQLAAFRSSLVRFGRTKCPALGNWLQAFDELYCPFVGRCIDSLVSGDADKFFDDLKHLSYYQTVMLRPMITDNVLPLFSLKREDVHFQIKICGSGGGGYFLGFSDDVEKTNAFMTENGFPITWIL